MKAATSHKKAFCDVSQKLSRGQPPDPHFACFTFNLAPPFFKSLRGPCDVMFLFGSINARASEIYFELFISEVETQPAIWDISICTGKRKQKCFYASKSINAKASL